MNQETMQPMAHQPPPQKSGCSPLAMVLVGCGTVFLLGVVGLGVAGFFGYRWLSQQVEEFSAEFEAKGYEPVMVQIVDETDPIDSPRVYVAQSVIIRGDVDADLAIMAQTAEIHGTVTGDLDFMGQVLFIKPSAEVTGDIRVKAAQVIQVEGTVDGEITGNYQVLNRPQGNRTPEDVSVDAEEVPETGEVPPDEADISSGVDESRDVASDPDET